jgi:hypothetical protein
LCSHDLTFATASFALTASPSLLQLVFELRSLLAEAMEEVRSPVLDIVGDVPEVLRKDPLLEASMIGSSSEDSSEVVAHY